jgi:hypothetical protein
MHCDSLLIYFLPALHTPTGVKTEGLALSDQPAFQRGNGGLPETGMRAGFQKRLAELKNCSVRR